LLICQMLHVWLLVISRPLEATLQKERLARPWLPQSLDVSTEPRSNVLRSG